MTKTTKVVHLRREPFDIRIDRKTPWGNPFEIGVDGTREEVVELYVHWILTQKVLLKQIHSLRGKTLGCHCAPKLCHGDILKQILETRTDLEIKNFANTL